MADAPDPQELARRYLDLWQQHLTQAATDPNLAAEMAKFWQNLPAAIAPGMPAWPPNAASATAGAPDNDTSGPETPETADGSSSDPASSDGGGDVVDELRSRMAALEERLAALESRPRSSGKRAAKGPRKRKS